MAKNVFKFGHFVATDLATCKNFVKNHEKCGHFRQSGQIFGHRKQIWPLCGHYKTPGRARKMRQSGQILAIFTINLLERKIQYRRFMATFLQIWPQGCFLLSKCYNSYKIGFCKIYTAYNRRRNKIGFRSCF